MTQGRLARPLTARLLTVAMVLSGARTITPDDDALMDRDGACAEAFFHHFLVGRRIGHRRVRSEWIRMTSIRPRGQRHQRWCALLLADLLARMRRYRVFAEDETRWCHNTAHSHQERFRRIRLLQKGDAIGQDLIKIVDRKS